MLTINMVQYNIHGTISIYGEWGVMEVVIKKLILGHYLEYEYQLTLDDSIWCL